MSSLISCLLRFGHVDFSPVGAYLEDVALGWVLSLLGLPSTSGGALVTGTQMADVTTLVGGPAFHPAKGGLGRRR
jgi:hypothetical protein